MNENSLSAADVAAVTRNNDGGMFGDNNGAWWIIILFLFAFCGGWGGNGWGGGNSGSVRDAYVLNSDFATIQRQLSDGFGGVEKGLDTIRNGLCDGFYTEAQLVNGLSMNMMQGFNGLGTQVADCCCQTQTGIERINTGMAMNTAALSRDVERGFCDTQYRDMANTNSLLQSGHADADRIIAKLDAMEMSRKDEKIAEQNQMIFNLQLKSSQEAQNAYLISQLGYQCPKPAYVVQPPQQVTFPTNACGQFGNSCGCGSF